MRIIRPLLFLVPFLGGCILPIQTQSSLKLDQPVEFEILPNDNERPVVEMPLEGDGRKCGKEPKVAVIDVDGLLLNTNLTGPYSTGDNPIDLFREKLDAARSPGIAAVVLRINSPGGSVTASEVMWNELMRFKEATHKPVVGCLMDFGCGGAYYLASGCDAIVAHPTTVTGGIGVILNLFNFQGTLNLAKVENLSVKAKNSPKIDLDYRIGVMNEDDKEMLVNMADELHAQFKKVVKARRPQLKDEASTFDGRVFLARQAQERGLIDTIGHLQDAIDAARTLAGRPTAGTVILHRKNDAARTPFATTPNVPLQASLLGVSVPAGDRNRLPTFLYLWQPDPSLERMSGK